jgi:hypothetical protein
MTTMKNIFKSLLLGTLIISASSCDDFLNIPSQGILSDSQLNSADNIEKLVISAYAQLGNDHYTVPNLLWPWGDLRAGDAYKGGDGPADIFFYNALETFTPLQPDMSAFPPGALKDMNNKMWVRQYIGISRVNNAMRRLNEISKTDFDKKEIRIAEMKFLRANFFFTLKILYNRIPWYDENASVADIEKLSNVQYTNAELWDKIITDLRDAAGVLPESQSDVGRPNKYTAKAFLAKALLYAAYEQNDEYQVVNIDGLKLTEVVDLVDEIILSDKFELENDMAFPFLWEYENGKESVWAIQRSKDDGTTTGNLDFSSMLNNPMSNDFGCCWFHIPSQNLVNSFKTGADGLPLFDTFNSTDLDLASNTVDPRLDHTVAMPGKPWKYEAGLIYNELEWTRQPGIYGPYSSMKENVSPYCSCFEKITPFMSSSKNTILIRYSDVLLWKAEALIELGRESEALPVINDVRQRAKNSTSLLKNGLGEPLSDYNIELYDASNWNQDYARKALRWERRLELALEGQRFFDLVRWGVASQTVATYLSVEKDKRTYLKDALFTAGKNEYMPIPYQQIELSKGKYQQNRNY